MKKTPFWRSTTPWILLTLLVGTLITFWLVQRQQQHNEAVVREQLQRQTHQITSEVIARFQLYEYGLRALRGMVVAAQLSELSRDKVQAYSSTRDPQKEFPGSRGFGYIERVLPSEVERYTAQARSDGAPDFTVRQITPHNDERFVIRYIEPLQNNERALGLDIGSEASRRQAAWTALQNNEATISAPITLVQATDASPSGFLLLLPVYRLGLPVASVAEREAAGMGWTYTPLFIDEVLQGLDLKAGLLHMSMRDTTDFPEGNIFFKQRSAGQFSDDAWSHSLQQTVFGRQWQIDFRAYPAFVATLNLPPPANTGLIGGLVTALLGGLQSVWMTARRRRREVTEANALLAAIVENASDAIVSESLGGSIQSWNRAAQTMFGYTRQDAMGQPLASLLLPPERSHEDDDLLELAVRQRHCTSFETTRLRSDGLLIDVSMTVSAICDARGRVVGAANLIRDISERKRHERTLTRLNADLEQRVKDRTQELKQASRFLLTVLDSVPLMIAYFQSDLTCRVMNRVYADFLHVTPVDAHGKLLNALISPALFAFIEPHIRSTLAGVPQQFECVFPERRGRAQREFSVRLIPDTEPEGVAGFYLIAEDVSELNAQRRGLELALQAQVAERQRLQSLVQGTGAGTWEWHVKTGEVRINEEWARLLGYTAAELAPVTFDTWAQHMHPDDLMAAQTTIRQHFAGEILNFETEVRMRHRTNGWVWIISRGQVTARGAHGEPEWMFGTHLDITARRVAEERLRGSEAFLERVGKVAGVGGWRLNLADQKITWTSQTRRIAEVDDDYEPALDTGIAFYPPEAQPRLIAAIQAAIDTGKPFDLELPYTTARGQPRWVRAVGEVEHDPQSTQAKPVALIGALMDFTERHEAAEVLRRAQMQAEAASQSKSKFLANMSHEIRTPLNAVLGVFYLLADTPLDADQSQLLGKAQLAGRSLLGIVNDVLDLAKIEAGEVNLSAEPYHLPSLLHELQAIYALQAAQKGLAFRLEQESALPAWLLGDAQRVRQILTNLIGNAVKFTEAGSIEVVASSSQMADAGGWLRLAVKDTGIGIAQEAQAGLFQPFIQADDTATRRFGGTGLGLSIVRELSEAMGGRAGVISAPGEGSEFWVELPLVPVASSEQAGLSAAPRPLEIAVVDDSAADSADMAALVRSLGWRAVELPSGEALIHYVTSCIALGQHVPDAMLVACQIPGLSALETLSTLAQQVGGEHMPVALLVSAQRGKPTDAGDAKPSHKVLDKPLEASILFNAINESLVEREGNAARMLQDAQLTALPAQWLAGVKVLLVDDSEVNLEIARRLLEKFGAQVRTATNGGEALQALHDHAGDIDAVLMDMQMPVMDGLEATRRLRQVASLATLPVIALTAGALAQERERAFQAGMNDFLTKPLEPEALIRTVRLHVERARGTPLPLVSTPVSRPSSDAWPVVEGIDAESAAARLNHDAPLFLKLLGWIGADFTDLQAIRSPAHMVGHLADEKSRKNLRERVHKLRGSAGTLGAIQVHATASAAEAALVGHNGEEVGCVLALSEALRQLVAASQPAIAAALASEHQQPLASAGAAAPADQASLEALAQMLRSQDLQALDLLDEMQGPLASAIGADTAAAISRAMDVLDFPGALTMLEQAAKA